jgi:hypothetical protein
MKPIKYTDFAIKEQLDTILKLKAQYWAAKGKAQEINTQGTKELRLLEKMIAR